MSRRDSEARQGGFRLTRPICRRRSDGGAATVEFALLLPLVLLLLAGVVEFTLIYKEQIALRNAASAGAIFALNRPLYVEDTNSACSDGNNISAQSWKEYSGLSSAPPPSFVVSVEIDGTVVTGCSVTTNAPSGVTVKVTVSRAYDFFFLDLVSDSSPTVTVSGSQEGPVL